MTARGKRCSFYADDSVHGLKLLLVSVDGPPQGSEAPAEAVLTAADAAC